MPRFRLFGLIAGFVVLAAAMWPGRASAQADEADNAPAVDDRSFDIGVIIDNRSLPRDEADSAMIDALITLLDRQMFIDHIMLFERPDIRVVCDLFGCPPAIERDDGHPSLIWRITREDKARLLIYYIGDGRLEGVERQLLFKRRHWGADDDVVGLSVDWLHRRIEDAGPKSATMLLDTSFSPRPLPCVDADPQLIDEALLDVRRIYERVAADHWRAGENVELGATTPAEAAHCDRFDHMLAGKETPLFTQFLLEGLSEAAADQEPFGDEDRLVDLGEITDYLNDRIDRAVRFQWGRRQHVRAVGGRSEMLASVDPRALRPATKQLLERRKQPPVAATEPEAPLEPEILPEPEAPARTNEQEGGENPAETDPAETEVLPPAPACADDETGADCHPCVLDPNGEACAQHCREGDDTGFCGPDLTSGPPVEETEPVSPVDDPLGGVTIVPVPIESGDPSTTPSAACRFATERIAPYASVLVARIQGGIGPACSWASDPSEPEFGPLGQIFAPVAWRLGREAMQDTVSCVLDCAQQGSSAVIDLSDTPSPLPEPASPVPEASVREALVRQSVSLEETTVPQPTGTLHREVCHWQDEPHPPYIGLPRWMPGTLIIAELLEAFYDCPEPATEPTLPVPIVLPLEAPERDETPSPAVAAADGELADWPPAVADINIPRSETGAETGAETEAEDEPADRVEGDDVVAGEGEPPQTTDEAEDDAAFEARFVPTTDKVRWLQSALTVGNFNPGPIDGVVGPRTRIAIQSWRRAQEEKERTGPLTEREFATIIEAFARRFGQIDAARSF